MSAHGCQDRLTHYLRRSVLLARRTERMAQEFVTALTMTQYGASFRLGKRQRARLAVALILSAGASQRTRVTANARILRRLCQEALVVFIQSALMLCDFAYGAIPRLASFVGAVSGFER